jgi:tetratricopeptide (TPR) repeat protein
MNSFNRVDFIGRVEELTKIEALLKRPENKSLISIEGIGGIGKTRLLEESYRRFSNHYKVCKIIDFDNNLFQIQGSIIAHISKELNGDGFFNSFFELKNAYEKWEQELIIGDLTLKEHSKTLNRLFVQTFNRLSNEQKIVVIFDTLDKLDSKAIPYLAKFFASLENVVFLVAGRKKNLQRLMKLVPEEQILHLELKKFNHREIEAYIQKKRIISSVLVHHKTEEKIGILSRGKPILIDLAIDRIGMDNSISWLDEYSIDDIVFLNRHQKEALERRFEEGLIANIVKAENRVDEYILLLWLIQQANSSEIEKILELDARERDKLFEYSKDSVIFKNIDNCEVALHDEISRMLELYIAKEGRFEKYELFIERSITVLEETLQVVDSGLTYQAFIKQRILRLKLFKDVALGASYFLEVFEEEFNNGLLFKYIKPLIRNIEQYIDKIDDLELKSKLLLNIAHYHIKDGKYDLSYKLMMQKYSDDLKGECRINLLLSLVNAKIRIGKFQEAIEASKEALSLSQAEGNRQLEAKALNILGWAYRNNGKLSKAINYYLKANRLVEENASCRESQMLKGWIHNNLAFAYAQRGNIKSATKLADIAKGIWENLEFKTGLGALYEVYGEIYLKYGYYERALSYYDHAINIFIERGDKDFSKRAFVERATVYRYAGELALAKDDLEDAIDIYIDISSLDVRLNYEKAYIAMEEGAYEEARALIAKAIEIEEFHPNPEYRLFCIYLMLLIGVQEKNLACYDTMRASYHEFKLEYPDSKYYLVEAIIFKKFGDFLLLKDADTTEIVNEYQRAFKNFKLYGESEPYSLYSQMKELDELFEEHKIGTDKISFLGQALCHFWEEEDIHLSYPETLHILSFWKEGKFEGV